MSTKMLLGSLASRIPGYLLTPGTEYSIKAGEAGRNCAGVVILVSTGQPLAHLLFPRFTQLWRAPRWDFWMLSGVNESEGCGCHFLHHRSTFPLLLWSCCGISPSDIALSGLSKYLETKYDVRWVYRLMLAVSRVFREIETRNCRGSTEYMYPVSRVSRSEHQIAGSRAIRQQALLKCQAGYHGVWSTCGNCHVSDLLCRYPTMVSIPHGIIVYHTTYLCMKSHRWDLAV